jgi:hypothetical protein
MSTLSRHRQFGKGHHGEKIRPHFEIVEWRELGGGNYELAAPSLKPPSLPPPVKPVTIVEELNDDLPAHLKGPRSPTMPQPGCLP